jgi:outer membrane cobalamin receptor
VAHDHYSSAAVRNGRFADAIARADLGLKEYAVMTERPLYRAILTLALAQESMRSPVPISAPAQVKPLDLARMAACSALVFALFLMSALQAHGQRARGELRIEAQDPQGAMLAATAELVSDANQFRRKFVLGADGRYVAQDLGFGTYRLSLRAKGFAPWTRLLEIRSEVPVRVLAKLELATVSTEIKVSDSAMLLDHDRTGAVYSIGQRAISEQISVQPGRDLSDLVDAEPGWLYEANGTLHPRGSEYDVQYVVDGLPLTQNRSPAFAPALDARDVESMRVLTTDFPAEYGRKLGGIIEVTTDKNAPVGLHGFFDAAGGSFDSANGSAGISYGHAKDRLSIGGNVFHTERYLDPPVLENFTNRANADGFSASYEHDFSDHDRLRMSVTRNAVRFLVPNELVQEQAGQRQDLANTETSGHADFQHIISPQLLLTFSGSARDAGTTLSSNPLSIPVIVSQNRGYREGYARADLAAHHGHNDWKVGIDSFLGPVREQLQYTITDPTQFDPGTQSQLQFSSRRWDFEPSAYAQDQLHFSNWNLSAGLRFDHYGFVVHESAWSPRIGASRYFPRLNLLVHASYDRVFQTPAVENLLLASSPVLDSLDPIVIRLPVRPARANYYEAGFTKAIVGKLRLDANVFRRDFRNYSDDDVLLDTGVSFPIAFAKATIVGEEVRLEVPQWGRFSGYLTYANQTGIGRGPITGGLFLGSDAAGGLIDASRFPVSQDQRNTVRARVRFQPARRLWLALGGEYGSGLPADTKGEDPAFLTSQFGPGILSQVNLDRGRVRPNFSLNAAAGAEVYRKDQRSMELQLQSGNLTDRLNVINFASLFSGTAVAPPRSLAARVRITF